MSRVIVYHFIDHNGHGTMHNIVEPLCKKYKNHKIRRCIHGKLIKVITI